MVGVKKFVVRRVEAAEKVRQLVRKYRSLKISLQGSVTHKRMNLLPDQASLGVGQGEGVSGMVKLI